MDRRWLVLLLVGCVLLAGCSLPGNGPADGTPTNGGAGGDGGTYPQGWNADGLANATLATQGADDAIAGQEFVERRVVLQPRTIDGQQKYLVDVLVVRLDRGNERLLTERRFYVVSNETAREVVDSGLEALGDRPPDEVKQTFLNASGGFQRHRLGNRTRVTRLNSSEFSSATNQPLPAVFAAAVSTLEGGTYTDVERGDGTITYTVENVTSAPFESGSGHVTVRENGLVPEFAITQSGRTGSAASTYDLQTGDVTVEPPAWTANASASGQNRSGSTPPGTAAPTPTGTATGTPATDTTSTTATGS